MRDAKVIKGARLRKSELVDCASVGEDCLVAVHIVWRAKLPVGCTGIAASDAVAVTKPGPPDGITDGDICCRRRKRETILPYSYIENLARTRWYSAHDRPSVSIHNMDDVGVRLFQFRYHNGFLARCSLRRKRERKHRCEPKCQWYYCVRSFHGLTPCPVRQCLRISLTSEPYRS